MWRGNSVSHLASLFKRNARYANDVLKCQIALEMPDNLILVANVTFSCYILYYPAHIGDLLYSSYIILYQDNNSLR